MSAVLAERANCIHPGRPLERDLLKVFNNEGFYATSKPDFVDLGSVSDFGPGMVEGFGQLLDWATHYDWVRSAETTIEKTFMNCVRVQPAMPEIFGKISPERLSPWSTVGFNPDERLIGGTRACIAALKAHLDRETGIAWRGTSVQLPGIAPGGLIAPHVDGYLAYQWSEKIHIPLITNAAARNVTFGPDVAPTAHHLEVGRVYIINNLEPHAAFNFGGTYRAHLIMDFFAVDKYAELVKGASKSIYLTDPPGIHALNAAFKAALDARHQDLSKVYRGLL